MRILYIAGFFAPILAEIQKGAGACLDERSVVWIPQRRDKDNQLDLSRLKSDLLDQARRGASVIHICCYVFRNQEHIVVSLNAIRDWAIARHPSLQITIERLKNARDAATILARIREFEPNRALALPASLACSNTAAEGCCFIHGRFAGQENPFILTQNLSTILSVFLLKNIGIFGWLRPASETHANAPCNAS
jgi:hypothetical protein